MTKQTNLLFKRLLGGIDYQKAILFGSRARGGYSKGSDYDILLVMRHSIALARKIRLSIDLRKRFAENGIDADVIVKSKGEVDYFKNKTGSVVKNALKEGVVL